MLCSFRVGGGGKKRAFTGVGALLLMAALALYLSGTYSFLFAAQLKQVNLLPLLIMMMPVLAVVAGLFFTVFAAQGILFGGRDNDLMLSLPVPAFVLLLARVLALYLENLFFSAFVMLPAAVAYLIYGGAGGGGFVLSMLVGTAVIALIPTLLALILGFLLAWVSSKFTRKSGIPAILYLLLLVGIFFFSFRASFLIQDLAQAAAGIQTAFSGWGLPFILLKEAACEGSILSLLLLVCLCMGPFLLTVCLFARRYQRIITGLGARGARSDYRLGQVQAGGQRRALLRKESARFFGTPIYLFNSGIGLILLLVVGGAALVKRDVLTQLLEEFSSMGLSDAAPMLALALCFLLSTVAITASSISLEGKQLWILKSAPVTPRDLFLIKTGFQLLLTLPCLLVGVVSLSLGFALSPAAALLLFAVGTVFALFTAPFGLLMNLLFPKLDAMSDMAVVKQSASAMISIFGPMVLVLAGMGLWILTRSLLPFLALLVLCAGGAWALLFLKGPGLFAALS